MLKMLIIVFCIIGVLFILGSFIFLITFKKNRVEFNKEQIKKNEDLLIINRKIWMRNTKRSVQISNHDYFELFETFPYLSDFSNTKEYLLSKGFSFKITEETVEELKNAQYKVLQVWLKEQKNLLKTFDQVNLVDNYSNRNFLMKFYNDSLNIFMNEIITVFVPKILENKISFLKGIEKPQNFDIVLQVIEKRIKKYISLVIEQLKYESGIYQQTHSSENFQDDFFKKQNISEQFNDEKWAYDVLSVSEKASMDEIKKQYRKLAMTYHPDRNKTPEAKDKMVEINQAYDFIKTIRKE